MTSQGNLALRAWSAAHRGSTDAVSDGVTEAMNEQRELFGVPRILESLQCGGDCPLADCQDKLMRELETFRGSSRFDDDISLVSLEVFP